MTPPLPPQKKGCSTLFSFYWMPDYWIILPIRLSYCWKIWNSWLAICLLLDDMNCTVIFQKNIFQAVMDVNTEGVEAAAATGISIIPYSAFIEDLNIDFNRPFAYFIVEKSTFMILFAGIMENPDELA